MDYASSVPGAEGKHTIWNNCQADELGAGVRAKAQDDFGALGFTLKSFYIGNLKPSDKFSPNRLFANLIEV